MKLTGLFLCCSSRAISHSEDPSSSIDKANDTSGPPPPTHAATSAKPVKSNKTVTYEPYSSQRASDLFKTYADADESSVIGAEGFIKLCTDADIAMDGSLPLLLHWLLKAEDMMKIQKTEWDRGMSELQYVHFTSISIVAMTVFAEFPLCLRCQSPSMTLRSF